MVCIVSENTRTYLLGVWFCLCMSLPSIVSLSHSRPSGISKTWWTHLPDRHLLRLGEAKLHEPFANTRLGLHQAWFFGRVADPSRQVHLSMSTRTKIWPRRHRCAGGTMPVYSTCLFPQDVDNKCVFAWLTPKEWVTDGIGKLLNCTKSPNFVQLAAFSKHNGSRSRAETKHRGTKPGRVALETVTVGCPLRPLCRL